ncbi:MAG TPA: hypothetical protein VLD65_00570, partial [Anaerolineales bacterium]|nr:hypothetical protein [Anaerolineales bacterium]
RCDMWHGYVGIEDLGLTVNQRNTLVAALRQLGPASDPQPARLNHWRVRLDDKAVIFEALFNDQDWTVETIKTRLAGIFGIDPALINHTTTSSVYGPVIVFKYPSNTNKLRMIAFAGVNATWEQSRQACSQYLLDNLLAWDNPATP